MNDGFESQEQVADPHAEPPVASPAAPPSHADAPPAAPTPKRFRLFSSGGKSGGSGGWKPKRRGSTAKKHVPEEVPMFDEVSGEPLNDAARKLLSSEEPEFDPISGEPRNVAAIELLAAEEERDSAPQWDGNTGEPMNDAAFALQEQQMRAEELALDKQMGTETIRLQLALEDDGGGARAPGERGALEVEGGGSGAARPRFDCMEFFRVERCLGFLRTAASDCRIRCSRPEPAASATPVATSSSPAGPAAVQPSAEPALAPAPAPGQTAASAPAADAVDRVEVPPVAREALEPPPEVSAAQVAQLNPKFDPHTGKRIRSEGAKFDLRTGKPINAEGELAPLEVPAPDGCMPIAQSKDIKLGKLLHAGGAAKVHAGWYKGRPAAMKVAVSATPGMSTVNESEEQMMQDEGKLMLTLHHPNVINFYAYGKVDGLPCLVMEYMNKGSLWEVLCESTRRRAAGDTANDPLPMKQRVKVLLGTCLGMDYLHQEANIIHRDLKSQNVLLNEQMKVKVTDFGIRCVCNCHPLPQTIVAARSSSHPLPLHRLPSLAQLLQPNGCQAAHDADQLFGHGGMDGSRGACLLACLLPYAHCSLVCPPRSRSPMCHSLFDSRSCLRSPSTRGRWTSSRLQW